MTNMVANIKKTELFVEVTFVDRAYMIWDMVW